MKHRTAADIIREDDQDSLRKLVAASGAPAVRPHVLTNGIPLGLTIVCPPLRIHTVEEEKHMQRVAAGLLVGWIHEQRLPAVFCPASHFVGRYGWQDGIRMLDAIGLLVLTGYHFRGLSEDVAVVLADGILSRIIKEQPTICTCSVDPSLLAPRWHADVALVAAFQQPSLVVRVDKTAANAEHKP
jgi:hypothetical protein